MLGVDVVDVTASFGSFHKQRQISCPSSEDDKLICSETHCISLANDSNKQRVVYARLACAFYRRI